VSLSKPRISHRQHCIQTGFWMALCPMRI